MATPREQFIELRKSGKTPLEARQAVMSTVAPSTPVMDQMAGKTVAERQTIRNDIPTPAPTPNPPAPVTPPAPTITPSGATLDAN
jgi:hypothetical protein